MVLVKDGTLKKDDFFVAGSAFGRVRRMYAAGEDFKVPMLKATTGMCVHVCGVWKQVIDTVVPGVMGCAPDDLLYALPKERAYRICEYRKTIERLAHCQISGPPMKFTWEADAPILEGAQRTQADFAREG